MGTASTGTSAAYPRPEFAMRRVASLARLRPANGSFEHNYTYSWAVAHVASLPRQKHFPWKRAPLLPACRRLP
eukprot:15439694-Alexandrium_andersonii.AAC.1